MPFAVAHVLVPIIILELCRDNFKKCSKIFSKRHVFLVGLAGLSPDIDILFFRIAEFLGTPVQPSGIGHRIIFHNIWIPIGFLGFFILFYYALPKFWSLRKNKAKKFRSFGKVFLVLFIGFSIHLLLDAVLTGHVMPLYPLNTYIVNWDLVGKTACATGIPQLTILVSMDALLLILWLWHEEMEKHILDYF